METTRRWSSAMRQAWEFCLSGVGQGLSGRSSLSDFRSGGGAIRTSDWYYLRRNAIIAFETETFAKSTPEHLPVPEAAFAPLDMDYQNEYILTAIARGTDPGTGLTSTRHITVESDTLLTLERWGQELDELLTESINTLLTDYEVQKMNFYHRTWTGFH